MVTAELRQQPSPGLRAPCPLPQGFLICSLDSPSLSALPPVGSRHPFLFSGCEPVVIFHLTHTLSWFRHLPPLNQALPPPIPVPIPRGGHPQWHLACTHFPLPLQHAHPISPCICFTLRKLLPTNVGDYLHTLIPSLPPPYKTVLESQPQALPPPRRFIHTHISSHQIFRVKARQDDPKFWPIFQLRAWSHCLLHWGRVSLGASCLLPCCPFLFSPHTPASIDLIPGCPPSSLCPQPRIISGGGSWARVCCRDLDFKAERVPGADSQRALFLAQPGRATAGSFCLVAPGCARKCASKCLLLVGVVLALLSGSLCICSTLPATKGGLFWCK
ncbi:PREDICTED: astrocytic phosphoprotein PEA-15 isoform X1 [Miniopterus natalensis]|uniref:astrocytic phosphoprotein PEA-15 isoform X1 n=1 Tax=Miniopterus natalensis TaxID=291302 RepID=UPI0007A720BB|nr:PREDICTED: astrocytic phosphoprotein PEA-15 isoform X1 [Miniopterus natalensis]